MNNELNTPTLSEFCNSLVLLAGLESKIKNEPVDQAFIEKIKMWSTGIFRLVVMGEVKKGKSSFINALLGVRDLVPVSSDIATSTIYKICYGNEISYKVFFTQASGKPALVIPASDIENYGTEKGNPNNEKEVDFIQIFVPSLFLKNGLVIIDTPGLGGLFKQHKRITYEYVPKADAVFLVSDSVESPIGQAELDLLEDLKKITDQIYFVQTKAMAVGTEERQSREKNNRNTLITHGNIPEEKLKYFVVDSHLKHEADETKDPEDLAESGFISLAMFINNEIKPNIRQSIMKNALRVVLPKYNSIESHLAQAEKICNADTLEQQNSFRESLGEAENELRQWQNNLPALQEKFQDGIRCIKEDANNYLKVCRPNGPVHAELEQRIFDAPNMEDLLYAVDEIINCLPNLYAEYKFKVCNGMQNRLTQLIEDLTEYNISLNCKTVSREYSDTSFVNSNTDSLKRMKEQNTPKGPLSFDNIRTGFYGGMAGFTMAKIAGLALGSVIPGIGPIIGSAVGLTIAGTWAAHKSLVSKGEQDLKNAKSQAGMGLSQAVSTAYQSVIESTQQILNEVERETFRALKQAVTNKQSELKEQNQRIKDRQAISAKELADEKGKLDQMKKEFALVTKVLSTVR